MADVGMPTRLAKQSKAVPGIQICAVGCNGKQATNPTGLNADKTSGSVAAFCISAMPIQPGY